mmetsp:Transcript_64478/g.180291  ORF Transcript_64478/g.180291 Transcript_64478/m.180291 type:complete len:222 (+) Transcript_64478:536-1201(+)
MPGTIAVLRDEDPRLAGLVERADRQSAQARRAGRHHLRGGPGETALDLFRDGGLALLEVGRDVEPPVRGLLRLAAIGDMQDAIRVQLRDGTRAGLRCPNQRMSAHHVRPRRQPPAALGVHPHPFVPKMSSSMFAERFCLHVLRALVVEQPQVDICIWPFFAHDVQHKVHIFHLVHITFADRDRYRDGVRHEVPMPRMPCLGRPQPLRGGAGEVPPILRLRE